MVAKKATTTVPVVMVSADPVAAGLVASLARPGGNITGVAVEIGNRDAPGLRPPTPDRDGALAHERDRHRVGAHALARDAAGGAGGVAEGE